MFRALRRYEMPLSIDGVLLRHYAYLLLAAADADATPPPISTLPITAYRHAYILRICYADGHFSLPGDISISSPTHVDAAFDACA